MKQNVYDDPQFFAGYAELERSRHGLQAASEWPALRALLPPLAGVRALDLGCGFGAHCRFLREQGAASVVGVDLSERMLERARAASHDPAISWVCAAIEDVAYPDASFDLVFSSLAFHYVARWDVACREIFRMLAPGGALVFSCEHPMFTARAEQAWHVGPDGAKLHWPVDNYGDESPRRVSWFRDGVIKHHRSMAGIVNPLLDAGFVLRRLLEPVPSADLVAARPAWKDEPRRPMFLLVSATKGQG
jgi:SAM-dependent methyltransferase